MSGLCFDPRHPSNESGGASDLENPQSSLPSGRGLNEETIEWKQVSPDYDELISREIQGAKELEIWIRDWAGLNAYLDERLAWLTIRFAQDVRVQERKCNLQAFHRDIVPQWEMVNDRVSKKLLDSPYLNQIGSFFTEFVAQIRRENELFREENLPLLTQEEELGSEYQAIIGSRTVDFQGERLRPDAIKKHFQNPDRDHRMEAFLALREALAKKEVNSDGSPEQSSQSNASYWEAIEGIYDRLCTLRHEIALNAGYSNYYDFLFYSKRGGQYSPEDLAQLYTRTKEIVTPLRRKLDQELADSLGLSQLKPWDSEADHLGRNPLRPFGPQESDKLLQVIVSQFRAIHPDFGEHLQLMIDEGRIDIAMREGKRPGGFHYGLAASRSAFIFGNANGEFFDGIVTQHEGGHYMRNRHSLPLDFPPYLHSAHEVAEVDSHSMELFCLAEIERLYPQHSDAEQARFLTLRRALKMLYNPVLHDEFQRWIYRHPGHTSEERRSTWKNLNLEYGDVVDWSGYEDVRDTSWLIPHIVRSPLYFVEYAIAQSGALQLYRRFLENRPQAIEDYRTFLSVGGSLPIRETFENGNIEFDPRGDKLAEIVDFLESQMGALADPMNSD